jgi:hypothetical protein
VENVNLAAPRRDCRFVPYNDWILKSWYSIASEPVAQRGVDLVLPFRQKSGS